MTNEEKLTRAIDEIYIMTTQGLKAQLMREDRNFLQCWKIALRISERIKEKCKEAKEVLNES
jgi:hypothetical protein